MASEDCFWYLQTFDEFGIHIKWKKNEYLSTTFHHSFFSVVRVAHSFVFCAVFCLPSFPFVTYLFFVILIVVSFYGFWIPPFCPLQTCLEFVIKKNIKQKRSPRPTDIDKKKSNKYDPEHNNHSLLSNKIKDSISCFSIALIKFHKRRSFFKHFVLFLIILVN